MAKFTLKKAVIKVTEDEGNFFEIRGLSPNDIAQMLMLHRPVMEQMFNQYAARNPETMTVDDVALAASEVAISMLEKAPALVAQMIVLAADDIDEYDEYVKLPVGVQIDAVVEIGRLTFEMAGGPKKLLGLVTSLMQAKARPVPNASLSTNGTGAFAGT